MGRLKKENRIETSAKREASCHNLQKVLVALSGGADSVATAFCLKSIGLEIMALHCNFHLRGEESNRDMNFVKSFCENFNIPLRIKEFDISLYLKLNKGNSIEMACRDLRHKWFKEELAMTGYDRIVTGHNADDNIETLFLNLFRGSGTRGLKGMEVDNGIIWRPLLSFSRSDILSYLKFYGLSFVVDSTNLKSDFRRNFLRNEIIPKLREEWKGFDKAMHHTISNLNSENKIVEFYLKKILSENNQIISVEQILNFPAPLLLIKRFIQPAGPYNTTQEEVMEAIKANKPHIRKWRLQNGELILRNKRLFIEMGHGERSS
ncbi:MAG: tRNA lysidine(34) synthetase TilS [Muribaculaceae bacterium]|nr:tRNA lysidine(34) synthetase TilS [Muribaculaceae bacterium]